MQSRNRKDMEKVNTMYITDVQCLWGLESYGEDRRKRERCTVACGYLHIYVTYLKTERSPRLLGYLVHLRLRWMHSQGPVYTPTVKRHDQTFWKNLSPATAPKRQNIHKQPLGWTRASKCNLFQTTISFISPWGSSKCTWRKWEWPAGDHLSFLECTIYMWHIHGGSRGDPARVWKKWRGVCTPHLCISK